MMKNYILSADELLRQVKNKFPNKDFEIVKDNNNKNTTYIAEKQSKPLKIIYTGGHSCPLDSNIKCKYSQLRTTISSKKDNQLDFEYKCTNDNKQDCCFLNNIHEYSHVNSVENSRKYYASGHYSHAESYYKKN